MEKQSRTAMAAKSFVSSTIGNIMSSLLGFASRTVFIYTLGTTYLGINGLFTNILGMLSFAELGIGSAISFSLYKPLAEKDIEKTQAIINFYRTAYRIIATVIALIGIVLIPFLKYIVKGADGIDNLTFIYCLFLFNTVSSYLITYKTTLMSADQRAYLITNINIVVGLITTVVQIILLLLFKSFIIYLVSNAVIQLLSKIYLNLYTDKRYPYIKGRNNSQLSKEDRNVIFTKVKALIFHKVGEVSIYQTDNILTSAFINVTVVGLVSNFVLIIGIINSFVMSFFNSATAGLGNIVATETKERRLSIYKNYDFLAFWFFGWTMICLYFLLSPFIKIWIGEDKLIDTFTIALLCTNYYLSGMRVAISNLRNAAGAFEQDKWVAIAQAVVNIIVSIIGAKFLGLPGIYIGTLVSSMLPNIVRPIIVYKYVFEKSSKMYFVIYISRIVLMLAIVTVITLITRFITFDNNIINMCFIAILCILIPNITFIVIFRKREEFAYVKGMIDNVALSKLRRRA